MDEQRHRVGIVGAGTNTREMHVPGFRKIRGVEIVSVCNSTRSSSEKAARELGISRVYDRWQDLVAADDTDAILIGTWPYLHCPVTLAALEAGKHVLTEARMAMNAEEARRMREASRRKPHLVTQVVPAPHTLGVDATVKRLLAEGYLGALLAVELRAGGSFIQPMAPLHWRQDTELSGLNVMSLGIWYEVVLRWIGEAERVTARGKVFTTVRRDMAGNLRAVRIPEHLDVVADMACGAQAHLQISSVTGHAGEPELYLFGSEGTLRFSGGRLEGGRREDAAMAEIPLPPGERRGWRVEEEFIGAIRGTETVRLTTFDDGVRYMELTEAVARSLAEGRSIPVPI